MLNFVQVDEKTLIHGTKYKIEDNNPYYNRNFISIFNKYDLDQFNDKYLLWGKTTFNIELFNPYSKTTYVNQDMTMSIKGLYKRYIYKLEPLKEIIQRAMELRAINKILQNVMGDPLFNY